ncbi:MAG: HK97 family phage prohead protease [Candidatus Woesearchaeota archaeon]
MSKKREVRVFEFRKQELRAEENEGKKYIIGFIPYDQFSEDLGGFREVLRKGCFTKTILENRIYALINHNSDKCLGNSKSGTLVFNDTDNYLECRIEINDKVSFARDLYECVSRGDVVGLSFGFSAIKENWDNTNNIREIKEAKLYEVSFGVVFPAYTTTTSFVEARSIINIIENATEENRKVILDEIKQKYFVEVNNTQVNNNDIDTVSKENTQSQNAEVDLYYYKLKVLELLK